MVQPLQHKAAEVMWWMKGELQNGFSFFPFFFLWATKVVFKLK